MKKRRRFTTEFKANVVRMILDEGKTQAEVAEELGIHPNRIQKPFGGKVGQSYEGVPKWLLYLD